MHHVTWLETSGKYWSWNLNSFQKSKVLKQQFKSKDLKYDYKNSEILHNRFCLIMPIDIEKSFKGLQIRTSPSYQVLGNTTEILGNTTEILGNTTEILGIRYWEVIQRPPNSNFTVFPGTRKYYGNTRKYYGNTRNSILRSHSKASKFELHRLSRYSEFVPVLGSLGVKKRQSLHCRRLNTISRLWV